MQRVLSFPMVYTRSGSSERESSEFITKRVCFSFICCVGFMAILGGFLLGKFTSERQHQIKLNHEAHNKVTETLYLQEAIDMLKLNSLKMNSNPENIEKLKRLGQILQCPIFKLDFNGSVDVFVRDVIGLHVNSLTHCFHTANLYIEDEIYLDVDDIS